MKDVKSKAVKDKRNSKSIADIIWKESDEFDDLSKKSVEPYKHKFDELKDVWDALNEKHRVEASKLINSYQKEYHSAKYKTDRNYAHKVETEYTNQCKEIVSRFKAEDKELKKKFDDKAHDLAKKDL